MIGFPVKHASQSGYHGWRMPVRWWCAIVFLGTLTLFGCKSDDDGPSTPANPWSASHAYPRGMAPVPSTTGAILFLQEEDPAGLYMLSGTDAVPVSVTDPAVRADYSWSQDGNEFAFSRPPSSRPNSSGIFLVFANSPSLSRRLWDQGSHPRFIPNENALLCAGPENDGGDAGIWQVDLNTAVRSAVAPSGVYPEVSPDGGYVAYLILGGTQGRILVVLNRESGRRDTLVGGVLNYCWLGDSRTIAFEDTADNTQEIRTIDAHQPGVGAFVAIGTHPAAFTEGTDFVFTGIAIDRLDGIFSASPGHTPSRISATGNLAAAAGTNRITAQDSLGILLLTR
jgi:hypothetical protein